MARMKGNEEKKPGKLQWILFVIIIPIVFAITMLFVVLTIMGINPIESIKKPLSSLRSSKLRMRKSCKTRLKRCGKKPKTKMFKSRTYKVKSAKKTVKSLSLKKKSPI